MKWENIDAYHLRLKVPGGWIVKAHEEVTHNLIETGQGMTQGYDYRVAMCFVPDPIHGWVI